MVETSTPAVPELRSAQLPRRGEPSPDADPKPPPIRHSRDYTRLIVDVIAPVFCKLFDGIVVRKHIAMNTSEQRNGNLEDGDEQVIRRIADLVIAHR